MTNNFTEKTSSTENLQNCPYHDTIVTPKRVDLKILEIDGEYRRGACSELL
jgi:hypothetical protein